jgi:hypothetical protein
MGLFDVLRGRSSVPKPDLDRLFAIPDAALSLEAALDARPTGTGAVCFRAAPGAAMASTQDDAEKLIEGRGGPQVETVLDGFGFTWMVVHGDPSDLSGLVTALHAVNTDLETQGFGDSLLAFEEQGRPFGLVYLYKRGTFYPFAQQGSAQNRDALLERQIRDAVIGDIPVEADATRWLPLWNAPGLETPSH